MQDAPPLPPPPEDGIPRFERPLATVDVAIFSVVDAQLAVLLSRRPDPSPEPFAGRWALPGGFIDTARDASLQDCALRKLREKTGVEAPYLEQLGSWGDARRDPRGWCATHVYFALIPPPAGARLGAQPNARPGAGWFALDAARRKRLAFDHRQLLDAAVARLRGKAEYTSLPAFLLAPGFTLPELQQAYETVLGRPLDRSAFRKRMLDAGFLAEAGLGSGGPGRPAMTYRLRDVATPAAFPRTFRSGE
jgi:8-oxo-dGTP diphosphatase